MNLMENPIVECGTGPLQVSYECVYMSEHMCVLVCIYNLLSRESMCQTDAYKYKYVFVRINIVNKYHSICHLSTQLRNKEQGANELRTIPQHYKSII